MFGRLTGWTLATLLFCGAARAEGPPPDAPLPTPSAPPLLSPEESPESSDETRAAQLYEQAKAAEARGQHDTARGLAQKALDVSPNGRYASAVARLLERLPEGEATEDEPTAPPVTPDPTPGRVTYVISGTLLGAIDGLILAGTVSGIDASGVGAFALLGAGIGFGITFGSASAVKDASVPAHLWTGTMYGVGVASALLLFEQGGLNGNGIAAQFMIAMTLGQVAGTVVAANIPSLTAGGAMAGFTCGLHFPLIVVMGELFAVTNSAPSGGVPNTANPLIGGTTLFLGTVGLIGAEVLNRRLHWSGGRWALISGSGILSTGIGATIAAFAGLSAPSLFALVALSDLLGVGIGALATQAMDPEAASTREGITLVPRPGGLAFTF